MVVTAMVIGRVSIAYLPQCPEYLDAQEDWLNLRWPHDCLQLVLFLHPPNHCSAGTAPFVRLTVIEKFKNVGKNNISHKKH